MDGSRHETLTTLVRRWTVLRPTLFVLIGALAASAVTAIVIVVQGNFSETDGKVLGTTAAVAGVTLLALPSLVHLERRRYLPLSAAAIVASLAAFGMLVKLIWSFDLFSDTSAVKTAGTMVIIAFAANHLSLILFAWPKGSAPVAVCVGLTAGLVMAVATMLVTAIWVEAEAGPFWRALAALAILEVLGTITTPLLARITSPRHGS